MLKVTVAILIIGALYTANAAPGERRLLKALFQNSSSNSYAINERPASADGKAVNVSVTFTLRGVQKAHSGKYDFLFWVNQRWNDTGKMWNPSEYGGVNQISVQEGLLWSPDVVPFDAEEVSGRTTNYNQALFSNGSVIWIQERVFRASCTKEKKDQMADEEGEMELVEEETVEEEMEEEKPAFRRFRRKEKKEKKDKKEKRRGGKKVMTCSMKIGSWTYSKKQVSLDSGPGIDKVDTSSVDTYKVKVMNATVTHQEVKYDCCAETYPSKLVTITIEKTKGKW
jgi:hypothetical protein